MAINAIDQLIRADQSGPATQRRTTPKPDYRFSSLLDAQSARARVDRPQQPQRSAETGRREDDAAARPARAEQDDRNDRNGRTERTERERDDARPPKADRKNADKGTVDRNSKADKYGKASAEEASDADAAQAADASVRADSGKVTDEKIVAAEKVVVEEKPVKTDDAAPAAPVAGNVDPLAQLAVATVDVLAPVAAAVAPLVELHAPVEAEAAEIEKKAATTIDAALPVNADANPDAEKAAKPSADAKATKDVAPQSHIALPTATLAEVAKKSEPATEEFADFMLRSAVMSATASTDAGKDAAKADAGVADGGKDVAKEGKLIVTVSQPAPVAAPVAAVTAFAVQAAVSNDNVSLDVGHAAKAAVENEDAKPAAKSADPTNLFAQNLEAARGTQAASETKPAARMPIVPPHEQVAVNIRKAVDEGMDRISIHLNPADLGRIDIKIDMRADGTLRAAFAADRQQTLDLLKGDSRQLETALSDAGLRADAGGLNFSLRGDNRENAQAFRDMGSQYANKRGDDLPADDPAAPVAATTYASRRAGNGRVDLNA